VLCLTRTLSLWSHSNSHRLQDAKRFFEEKPLTHCFSNELRNPALTPYFVIVTGVRGGGAGGGRPTGLKNFRANSVFRTSASCWKTLNDKKYFNTVKNTMTTLFFRASESCSKMLNVKSVFNAVKIFRATLFLRASASCWKILNNKKYIFSTVNSQHPLFFRANAKLLKNSKRKKYIQHSEKFQGNSVFSGQLCFFRASASCSKIANGEKIFNTVYIFTWGWSV